MISEQSHPSLDRPPHFRSTKNFCEPISTSLSVASYIQIAPHNAPLRPISPDYLYQESIPTVADFTWLFNLSDRFKGATYALRCPR